MFNSDVPHVCQTHPKVRPEHKQASHVKAGFTRCGAMDHSHRLFDIFLSSGGNRQKKAGIWRKKMEY